MCKIVDLGIEPMIELISSIETAFQSRQIQVEVPTIK